MLHDKKISSFLVTNAQFPEAIRQLEPCTQLYVSVDASTKDSLKRIDRPLFKGIERSVPASTVSRFFNFAALGGSLITGSIAQGFRTGFSEP